MKLNHHYESFTFTAMTLLTVTNICVTYDHRYIPFVVITTWHFSHYYWVCNKSNMTGDISVARTAYRSEAPELRQQRQQTHNIK